MRDENSRIREGNLLHHFAFGNTISEKPRKCSYEVVVMPNKDFKYVDVEQQSVLQSFFSQRWSALLIEGLLVLVVIIAAGRFFTPEPDPSADIATIADLRATIAAYEQELANRPDLDLDALRWDAWEDMKAENYAAAIARYNVILELDPDDIYSLNSRGIAFDERGEHHKAIDDYSTALEVNPAFRSPYLNRGIAFEHAGDMVNAARDYAAWIGINGQQYTQLDAISAEQTVTLTMSEGAVFSIPFEGHAGQTMSAWADGVPAESVDPLLLVVDSATGTPLVGSDDIGESLNSWINSFELPQDGQYMLLVHHAGGGSYGDIAVSLQLEGVYDLDTMKQMAWEFVVNGDYDAAINMYDDIISQDATDPYTFNRRGIAFIKSDDFANAIDSYTRAIELYPDWNIAYTNRCAAYIHSDNYQAALNDCSHVIETNPSYPVAYLNRGVAFEKIEHSDAAAKDFFDWVARNGFEHVIYKPMVDGESIEVEMSQGLVYHLPFEASAGEYLNVTAEGVPAESVDPLILVVDSEGNPLVGSDDTGESLDSNIEDFRLSEDGRYTLIVHHAGGGADGTLSVNLDLNTRRSSLSYGDLPGGCPNGGH